MGPRTHKHVAHVVIFELRGYGLTALAARVADHLCSADCHGYDMLISEPAGWLSSGVDGRAAIYTAVLAHDEVPMVSDQQGQDFTEDEAQNRFDKTQRSALKAAPPKRKAKAIDQARKPGASFKKGDDHVRKGRQRKNHN